MTKHSITPAQLITDDQERQIVDLLSPAIRLALKQLGLSRDDAQRLVLERGGKFKAEFTPRLVGVFRSLVEVFNPEELIGGGWCVDSRASRLRVPPFDVDFTDIVFRNMLHDGERWQTVEDRIKRLRAAKCLCLTVNHFYRFWKMRYNLPVNWRVTDDEERRHICFDGTILRSPQKDRYVVCMYWDGCEWDWKPVLADNEYGRHHQSAVYMRQKVVEV